jgi:hypothetical protein
VGLAERGAGFVDEELNKLGRGFQQLIGGAMENRFAVRRRYGGPRRLRTVGGIDRRAHVSSSAMKIFANGFWFAGLITSDSRDGETSIDFPAMYGVEDTRTPL